MAFQMHPTAFFERMSIQVSIFLRKFNYDPLNRLLSATGREASTNSDLDLWANPARTGTGGNPSPSSMQAYTRTYAYDKMGNIQQLKQTAGNAFTRNFQYNSLNANNLLHAIKKADNTTNYATFTYDANGNKLTAGTERKYLWGHADQLKAYVNQAGTGEPSIYAQYLYSGGQRVKKWVRTSGGGTETTVYIDGVFEHKYNGTNSQSIMKVGGVATVRTGYAFDGLSGTSYELSNHLGSVSIRLDGSGSTIDVEEYYPFGDSSVRTWSGKRYRYVGKEKDAESGLYYYGARYYSAWTCRFISVDPLAGDYPQLTSFNYAGNKPINHFDIDGMQSSEDGGNTDPEHGTARTMNGCTDYWDGYKHAWVGENDIYYKLHAAEIYPKLKWYEKAGNFLKGFGKGFVIGAAFVAGVTVAASLAALIAPILGTIVTIAAAAYGIYSLYQAGKRIFNDYKSGAFQNDPAAWERAGELSGSIVGGMRMARSIAKAKAVETKPEIPTIDETAGSETIGEGTRSVEQPFEQSSNSTQNSKPSESTSNSSKANQQQEIIIRNKPLEPEKGYRGSKKHGINWTEGKALAKSPNKNGVKIPQGQWGSEADLMYAGEKAATLPKRGYDTFELPEGHSSKVYLPDGRTVDATHIWVRNNGDGTFHGFPIYRPN
jgi:RHS repeat-associated protein